MLPPLSSPGFGSESPEGEYERVVEPVVLLTLQAAQDGAVAAVLRTRHHQHPGLLRAVLPQLGPHLLHLPQQHKASVNIIFQFCLTPPANWCSLLSSSPLTGLDLDRARVSGPGSVQPGRGGNSPCWRDRGCRAPR